MCAEIRCGVANSPLAEQVGRLESEIVNYGCKADKLELLAREAKK